MTLLPIIHYFLGIILYPPATNRRMSSHLVLSDVVGDPLLYLGLVVDLLSDIAYA